MKSPTSPSAKAHLQPVETNFFVASAMWAAVIVAFVLIAKVFAAGA